MDSDKRRSYIDEERKTTTSENTWVVLATGFDEDIRFQGLDDTSNRNAAENPKPSDMQVTFKNSLCNKVEQIG